MQPTKDILNTAAFASAPVPSKIKYMLIVMPITDAAFTKVQGTYIPRIGTLMLVQQDDNTYIPTVNLDYEVTHIKASHLMDAAESDLFIPTPNYGGNVASDPTNPGGVDTIAIHIPNGTYPCQMVRIVFEDDLTIGRSFLRVRFDNGQAQANVNSSAILVLLWDMTTWKQVEFESA